MTGTYAVARERARGLAFAPAVSTWRRTRATARLVAELAVLWMIGVGANALVARTHLPVPGNALAMVATFGLLRVGVLRLAHVERAATLLVRNLSLFFVPYAVGIVGLWTVIAPHVLRSFGVLVVSVALGVAATGLTAQLVLRGRA